MIIVGDLACPTPACTDDLANVMSTHRHIFGQSPLICNFEGMISDGESLKTLTPLLFNHSSVVDLLSQYNTSVAAMANNHTLDLPHQFHETRARLTSANIAMCGVGSSEGTASQSVIFTENGQEVVLFNSCWDFLLYHQKNPSSGVFVAETKPIPLLEEVFRMRSLKPKAKIVIYFHWNFDLETLPFPMHRVFAQSLIDAGANLVVGTHSHCVQGAEQYRDGFIVYGLGNFFVPFGVFANGRLTYPKFAEIELIVDWCTINNRLTCHWFNYVFEGGHHLLRLIESSPLSESQLIKVHTPYEGMTHKEYRNFFKQRRRKRILIPIYTDHRSTNRNALYTRFLKLRAGFARTLARTGFLSWSK